MLEIRLFGTMSLGLDGQRLATFATRKAREAFAFLALYRQRRHARLALAGLLWPELDEIQARKQLRNTLWRIHKVLDDGAGMPESCLEADRELVGFRLRDGVWLDVAEFEECLGQGRGSDALPLSDAWCRRLERAVEIYQGDLLEGCYEEWCLGERERLRGRFLEAAGALMLERERRGQWEAAIDLAHRALAVDPLLESVHQCVMRCHAAQGNRAAALQQFTACARYLEEELDVEPLPETVALYRSIRASGAGSTARPATGIGPPRFLPPAGQGEPPRRARVRGELLAELDEVEDLLSSLLLHLSSLRRMAGGGERE